MHYQLHGAYKLHTCETWLLKSMSDVCSTSYVELTSCILARPGCLKVCPMYAVPVTWSLQGLLGLLATYIDLLENYPRALQENEKPNRKSPIIFVAMTKLSGESPGLGRCRIGTMPSSTCSDKSSSLPKSKRNPYNPLESEPEMAQNLF